MRVLTGAAVKPNAADAAPRYSFIARSQAPPILVRPRIDFLSSRAPPQRVFLESSDEITPPLIGGGGEVLGAEAFDDLGLRQPVSKTLALRIAKDGDGLEKHRHD